MEISTETAILEYLEANYPTAAKALKEESAGHITSKTGGKNEKTHIENALQMYNNHLAQKPATDDDEPLYKIFGRMISEKAPANTKRSARRTRSKERKTSKDSQQKSKTPTESNTAAKRGRSSSSSSDESEGPVRKPMVKAVPSPKTNTAAKKVPQPDSSSDESEGPVRKPMVKAVPSPKTNTAAKKVPQPDSSSDESEGPVRKPLVKAVPSPKTNTAAKKVPQPDSSSDESEGPVRKPLVKAVPSPKTNTATKRGRSSSSSSDEGNNHTFVNRRVAEGSFPGNSCDGKLVSCSARGATKNSGGAAAGCEVVHGSRQHFKRIDPTKVVFVSDELRNNGPRAEHMALRQNQEMMRVTGKNFNKLKQKNKNKLYVSGVDASVRSFKFDESD